MELICRITDEDLGEESVEMHNPIIRYASRGIVLRDDGKIAIFNKANKNEYKLPGGGLEEGDSFSQAFSYEPNIESVYSTKFIIIRDKSILEYFLKGSLD